MKRAIKLMLTMLICLVLVHCYAQAGSAKRSLRPINAPGASVAISLKNTGDNNVTIFVGPKDELNSPQARQKVYEAHSARTIYASINEVVCIIGNDDKPVSCVDVMPGAEKLEVNGLGTVISVK